MMAFRWDSCLCSYCDAHVWDVGFCPLGITPIEWVINIGILILFLVILIPAWKRYFRRDKK